MNVWLESELAYKQTVCRKNLFFRSSAKLFLNLTFSLFWASAELNLLRKWGSFISSRYFLHDSRHSG